MTPRANAAATARYLILCLFAFVSLQAPAELLAGTTVRSVSSQKDWLVDNSGYRATLTEDTDRGEIVLSNGLIRRRFRLAPNAATVAFDNLVTGQAVIRGIKPEAEVEIDGQSFQVGGLKGQPNYAFMTEAWMDQLSSSPSAMEFIGYEQGMPKERVKWARVRHHHPDAVWPPRGVYLRMDYRMPRILTEDTEIDSPANSGFGRKRLVHDDFRQVSDVWTRHESKAHPRSSFENEGKLGEIYTPANSCVFVERTVPADTRVVEAVIDPGTDMSATWGPGLAIRWKGKTIKFNLRPGKSSQTQTAFGVWDGQTEHYELTVDNLPDTTKPWKLRLRMENGKIFCEAGKAGWHWMLVKTLAMDDSMSGPTKVRVGKLGRAGDARDYSTPGDLVRLHVQSFSAYGVKGEALSQTNASTTDADANKDGADGIVVSVHYELYDGIPAMSKWITVKNRSDREIVVNRFKSEILAAVEYSASVEEKAEQFPLPNLHVETEYAFGSMSAGGASAASVHWTQDPDYLTQVNYARQNPCLLEVGPDVGPQQTVVPGETFESFRAFVLPHDSYDRERNGLAVRRMYRTVAPWVTENPLMMHVRYADWKSVKTAIDQCAEVGFEMVILTFGSGFNIENNSAEYMAKMTDYANYAKSKGIEIGGYSLLASRRVGGGHDVVMPEGQRPKFGNSPCIGSQWGQAYFDKLYAFYKTTGFTLLEHDGSYPGDVCHSEAHPGHAGYDDSQWHQWRVISDFYKFCREEGVYLNVPDFYYLAGSNKCGMGYRETNWSLPRAQQVIHTRQNIFDGTWAKTPSMGWMFVPLTQYHGGGQAATIEPLKDHLDHYELMLASNLGAGAQACYRGPRLYDTNETKALVQKWVDWYKRHRRILESDLIHLRRADARDLDYWLHVDPAGEEKGLLMVFNPLDRAVSRQIQVPLYYTGLDTVAEIREKAGASKTYHLDRHYAVSLPVQLGARAVTWFVIE